MKNTFLPLAAVALAGVLSMAAPAAAQYTRSYAHYYRPYHPARSPYGTMPSWLAVQPNYSHGHFAPPPPAGQANYYPPAGSAPGHSVPTGYPYPPDSVATADPDAYRAAPPAPPVDQPGPPPWVGPTGCDVPCRTEVCCEPCDEGGCFGGFELAFLRPRFSENTAMVIDPLPDDNIVRPFEYDFEASPRIWAGWLNECGLGAQVRYWHFDAEADTESFSPTPADPLANVWVFGAGGNVSRNAFAGVGETLTVSHDMEIDAIDLEAVQRMQWRRTILYGSLGGRYARIEQHFLARAITAAGVIDEMVDHDHSFEGFGPTAGLLIIQPVFDSGFGLYGNLRGSILFGEQKQSILEIKNAGANVGRDTHTGDEVLAIGEIGFGVQYARVIRRNAVGFVRAGYEGQIWWDAGGPINTDGNMGLEGFAFSIGVYR